MGNKPVLKVDSKVYHWRLCFFLPLISLIGTLMVYYKQVSNISKPLSVGKHRDGANDVPASLLWVTSRRCGLHKF